MEAPTDGSNLSSAIVLNWASARQIRVWVGRLQGRKGLLPESTWHRWREQLKLTGDRLYSPDQVHLILQFCQWLNEGGTVEGFKKTHNINSGEKTNVYQRQNNRSPSSKPATDDQFEWI